MKKIILDTDNTIGIKGRPMDDALAYMYLLGLSDECEILGITCNFGNGSVNEVYQCTRKLNTELGQTEMLVLRGCDIGENPRTEAARWIAETAAAHPGEISFLGIGSLGNLYGAYLIDNTVFDNLKEIVLMGGLTEPLLIHDDQPLAELNMSVYSEASACVLRNGRNISVITGNNCLNLSELPKDEFLSKLKVDTNPSGMFIAKKCGYRFRDKAEVYGADVSYCWDVVAAAYLLHPEKFIDHLTPCDIQEENLRTGYLNPVNEDASNAVINIPTAIDKCELQDIFYRGWNNVSIRSSEINFSCNGVYLDRLIQPAILIELAKEPAHGFLLLQRLKDDGFVENSIDPAGFYRTLKKLEASDFIVSKREDSASKTKNVFKITDLGRRALSNWYATLRHYENHIDKLLVEINKVK